MGTILSNLFGTNHGFISQYIGSNHGYISSYIGTNHISMADINRDTFSFNMASGGKTFKHPKKQTLGKLTKAQLKREKRLKAIFGEAYLPRHKRILTTLRHSVNSEFPVGDKCGDTSESRAYWNGILTELSEELDSEVFGVTKIVGMRARLVDNHQVQLEFDTRYEGHEDTADWQPHAIVEHLQVLTDFFQTTSYAFDPSKQ